MIISRDLTARDQACVFPLLMMAVKQAWLHVNQNNEEEEDILLVFYCSCVVCVHMCVFMCP